MYNKYLKPGNEMKLEVEVIPPYMSFNGVIEDIREDHIVVATTVEYAQKQERLVNCTVSTEAKACLFKTSIKGYVDGRLILSNPKPTDIKVVQRRNYARVPTDLQVNCYIIGINNKKIDSNKKFSATVKDIGGGGVLVNCMLSTPIGTVMVFELNLDGKPLILTVKVLRNTQNKDEQSRDLGCEFIGLSDKDKQRIIAYTNRILLKSKKK